MKIYVKGLVSLFLFFLVMSNINLAKKQCPCVMEGMKGELPKDVCLMTKFIKGLPKYDPKKAEAIVEHEKRPVILVFENIDQGMATGGGLLHGVTQDYSRNMYIWTIATVRDYF